MAEIKLTAAQQAVVDNEGGALLVSAAAGSGKTKVLVDRLLRKVLDPVRPRNIDDFLVITYTKAAAAELRLKIAQALSQRLALEPENRHLQRQLHRIYLAEISTVHAFCGNLLRTYAHRLDLPADFRVAEEAESRAILARVLDQDAGGCLYRRRPGLPRHGRRLRLRPGRPAAARGRDHGPGRAALPPGPGGLAGGDGGDPGPLPLCRRRRDALGGLPLRRVPGLSPAAAGEAGRRPPGDGGLSQDPEGSGAGL